MALKPISTIFTAILVVALGADAALANDRIGSIANIAPRQAAEVVQGDGVPSFQANENKTLPSLYEGAKWARGSVITWSIANAPGTADAPFSGYMGPEHETLVRQAVQTWATASGLSFQQVPDSTETDLRLGWGKFDTASTGIVGHTACQALSGEMLPNGIIRLEDPAQNSIVAGPSSTLMYSGTTASLYQVTLHEIGHALGLADNEDPNSIMYFEATAQNSTLASTDIAGIRMLYGTTSPSLHAEARELPQTTEASAMPRLNRRSASVQANQRTRSEWPQPRGAGRPRGHRP